MFLDDLAQAQRPAILVGGGAYKAREAIDAFARKLSIPVFRTWNALDICTDDSPVYCGTVGTYGGPGRNFGIQNCDLLLGLGSRFSGRITGGQPETFARGAKKYIVNVDEDPTAGQVEGVLIQQSCEQFMAELQGWPEFPCYQWLAQCRAWLGRYDPVKPEMLVGDLHHYGFMRRLSELLPANAIVVSDTGGNVIMMGHAFRSKRGQRIFTSNGNTPMNFSMCGAMGAWFAAPDRPVVCVIGDGGFQGNIQELQAIKYYNIPLKVFIINNLCLGNTRAYQVQNGMKEVACGPDGYSTPDFGAVVRAYGHRAFKVTEREEIDPTINEMMASTDACVADVLHANFFDYQPRMTLWDAGIEEMYPLLSEDEFTSTMVVDPLPGWRERRKRYKEMPDV